MSYRQGKQRIPRRRPVDIAKERRKNALSNEEIELLKETFSRRISDLETRADDLRDAGKSADYLDAKAARLEDLINKIIRLNLYSKAS